VNISKFTYEKTEAIDIPEEISNNEDEGVSNFTDNNDNINNNVNIDISSYLKPSSQNKTNNNKKLMDFTNKLEYKKIHYDICYFQVTSSKGSSGEYKNKSKIKNIPIKALILVLRSIIQKRVKDYLKDLLNFKKQVRIQVDIKEDLIKEEEVKEIIKEEIQEIKKAMEQIEIPTEISKEINNEIPIENFKESKIKESPREENIKTKDFKKLIKSLENILSTVLDKEITQKLNYSFNIIKNCYNQKIISNIMPKQITEINPINQLAIQNEQEIQTTILTTNSSDKHESLYSPYKDEQVIYKIQNKI